MFTLGNLDRDAGLGCQKVERRGCLGEENGTVAGGQQPTRLSGNRFDHAIVS